MSSDAPIPPPAPDRPMLPLPGEVGVQFTPPPPSILPTIMRQVEDATAGLTPGDVVFAAVADRKGGWNATIATKLSHGVSIDSWIGKSWAEGSELDYGVRVLGKWRIGGKR